MVVAEDLFYLFILFLACVRGGGLVDACLRGQSEAFWRLAFGVYRGRWGERKRCNFVSYGVDVRVWRGR